MMVEDVCAIKTRWAAKRIAELLQVQEKYCTGQKINFRVSPTQDSEGLRPILGRIELEPIPDDVPMLVAEILHSLRSALDHRAFELATAHDPHVNPRDVSFPTADTAEAFEKLLKKNKHFDDRTLQWLRAEQPFIGGKGQDLRALHDLNVHEKHRAVIATGTAGMANAQFALRPQEGLNTIAARAGPVTDFSQEFVLFRIPGTATFTGQISFALDLMFEGEVAGGASIQGLLSHLLATTRNTLQRSL